MNKISKYLFLLASFTVFFSMFGATNSNAQTGKAKVFKKMSANIVSRTNTFSELFSAYGGDPCETATPAEIGQTVGGALNNTDCRLDDGSYADFYVFEGVQGQQVTIHMGSSQVDSYLGLANLSGTFILEDDDSGGGLNAQIVATLPETGTYIILANSALPDEFGGYVLRLSGAQPCIYTVSPTTAEIPATGGTFTFNVNTQSECHWKAFALHNFSTTTSSGIGPGTVTYTVSQNGSGQTRSGSIIVSSAPLATTYNYFTISQPSVSCSYALSPSSVSVPATANSGSFQINAPAGCPWTVQSNSGFVAATGSGTGDGTIYYSVMHNNGDPRTATISVGGQTFTINQAGLSCVFTVSPRQINLSRNAATRTVNIDAQAGCLWTATTNVNHIQLLNNSGSGAGTITFQISALTDANSRSGAIQIWYNSGSTSVWIDQDVRFSSSANDFDGDGKSDISVFRPDNGSWYVNRSTAGFYGVAFGALTDLPAPADFDGDGKTDVAVFRPSNGTWYYLKSSTNTFTGVAFGANGDLPRPADFDGDGKADINVFRPSNGGWYRLNSSNGAFFGSVFGANGDQPIVADFDGDSKSDIAVFRPSAGAFYWLNSSSNSFGGVTFGVSTDIPTPGDFDGDGKTDIAVFRPSNGAWYRLNSSNGAFAGTAFGQNGDVPVAADYDGDGKTDIAVFRAGNWYRLNSSNGAFAGFAFGVSTDKPIPAAFQ